MTVSRARKWLRERRRAHDEGGSMAVEIVILAPVMMLFVLLIVMFGRYVTVRGDIDAAARDAARAASFEVSRAAALSAARSVVTSSEVSATGSLDSQTTCSGTQILGTWAAGETVTVRLTCKVSYEGLGLLGVPGSVEMVSESSVPLDPYRRFE